MEKTEKPFDAVALMRQIRDRMNAEIAGMDYQEQKRYLSDRAELRRKPTPAGKKKGRRAKP